MFAAKYEFSRGELCPVCGLGIEIYTTPGGRDIAMDPMCSNSSQAVQHYKTCNPTKEEEKKEERPTISMYGVNDPNHQLLAVGYIPDGGILVCQWAKGKGNYAGVPEDKFVTIKRVPFAYGYLTKVIKGKYPYTKTS
jgi:hypothetical protein